MKVKKLNKCIYGWSNNKLTTHKFLSGLIFLDNGGDGHRISQGVPQLCPDCVDFNSACFCNVVSALTTAAQER